MKIAFFSINFLLGALVLTLGVATLLRAASSVSTAAYIVGFVSIGLAAICLGLCKDCLIQHWQEHVKARRADMA